MAEASDPCLFTKRASRGTGASAVPGVCMITKTKVKWQPNDPSKGQAAVIEISAITRTQQAPGKPFIKLDTAAGPLILGFEAVTDRDDAVELLKQAKPAAPAKPAAAAASSPSSGGSAGAAGKLLLPTPAQAQSLFRADRDLESVYKSLVVSGILSEQEFWRTRQTLLRDRLASGGGGGSGAPRQRQRVGLPSMMLADVKPSADGQTEKVHFQLTPQVIQQIFTERPEVHRAYLAHVPHNMDEKAFWTRYFKQQYKRMARRRRQGLAADGAGAGAGDDDDEDELFAPFKKQLQEQEQLRAKLAMGRVDPTVNIAADAGERFSGGFGVLRDSASDPAAALKRTHLDSIARDINRHAAVVLEGAPEGLVDLDSGSGGSGSGDGSQQQEQQQQAGQDTSRIAAALAAQQKAAAAALAKAAAAGGGKAGGGGGGGEGVPEETLHEWQQRAASALEDLTLDDREKDFTPLNIHDPRTYFVAAAAGGGSGGGPARDAGSSGADKQQPPGGPPAAAGSSLLAALVAIQPLTLPDPPCDPALASAVLLELSQDQDDELVAEFGPVAASALRYPPQDRTRGLQPLLLEHLRGEALKTNELLRHFWGCMPLLSGPRAEKAARLAKHLQEQRATLAAHMATHPGTSQQVYVTMMLRPLAAAVDAALARHQQELQQRQRQQGKAA